MLAKLYDTLLSDWLHFPNILLNQRYDPKILIMTLLWTQKGNFWIFELNG